MKRAVWLATLMWCWMGATSVQASDRGVAEMVAKHEIEYLQRLYARATDQIGTNVPENIEAGRRFITGSSLRMPRFAPVTPAARSSGWWAPTSG